MRATLEPVITTQRHPADRILEIVQKLQQQLQERDEQIAALMKSPAKGNAPRGSSREATPVLGQEIVRVQSLIDEIDKKLSDTYLELSAEMRLTRERAELEAYLRGLRFPAL